MFVMEQVIQSELHQGERPCFDCHIGHEPGDQIRIDAQPLLKRWPGDGGDHLILAVSGHGTEAPRPGTGVWLICKGESKVKNPHAPLKRGVISRREVKSHIPSLIHRIPVSRNPTPGKTTF